MKLEDIALTDEYFIKRKLFPNVDFYSGIVHSCSRQLASHINPRQNVFSFHCQPARRAAVGRATHARGGRRRACPPAAHLAEALGVAVRSTP